MSSMRPGSCRRPKILARKLAAARLRPLRKNIQMARPGAPGPLASARMEDISFREVKLHFTRTVKKSTKPPTKAAGRLEMKLFGGPMEPNYGRGPIILKTKLAPGCITGATAVSGLNPTGARGPKL